MQTYYPLPILTESFVRDTTSFVLLESNRPGEDGRLSYFFTEPVEILETNRLEEVVPLLGRLDEIEEQFYLAGFFSYEMASAFMPVRPWPDGSASPLLWIGVFEQAMVFDHFDGRFYRKQAGGKTTEEDLPDAFTLENAAITDFEIKNLSLAISPENYQHRIRQIKHRIEAGDTYQVNFTAKYTFDFSGGTAALYADLKKKQAVAFNAFIKCNETCFLSLSPELFFKRQGNEITTRPMKGTAPRGRTTAEDQQIAAQLQADSKNRSENVMIVDLLRNDLGRIAETGSVAVRDLFAVERYDSLFQMTSTVSARLRAGVRYSEIIQAMFPCGSVTGAPKLSTMQIIRGLEAAPRGIYTGAIGFIAPDQQAQFNVPIRTVTIGGSRGEMGVGSGIVYDSDVQAEFAECQLKAHFLVDLFQPFSLIETMLWNGDFQHLPHHLQRLSDSAFYFDFRLNQASLRNHLEKLSSRFSPHLKLKVRLLLHKDGTFDIETSPAPQQPVGSGRVAVSELRTNSRDRFLFHKTTRRALYAREYEKFAAAGFADVIFMNEKDEITEGAISNIFVEFGEQLFTPPVSCGLLNGVYRQTLLENNPRASEKILHLADLKNARAVYLTNDVRGMTKAEVKAN